MYRKVALIDDVLRAGLGSERRVDLDGYTVVEGDILVSAKLDEEE